jgi:sec-independent protein translocase protein TatA
MPSLGLPEIILIILVIALLFGAKKIPELMRGIGTGIKELKKASNMEDEEEKPKNVNNSTQPK